MQKLVNELVHVQFFERTLFKHVVFDHVRVRHPENEAPVIGQNRFKSFVNFGMRLAGYPKIKTAKSPNIFIIFLIYKLLNYFGFWLYLKHF